MREQLVQYVNLLFAGTDGAEEVKQEILQNTLDRFDDLVARGSTPEAAYRQAISGIGDINEILGGKDTAAPAQEAGGNYDPLSDFEGTAPAVARMLRAIAIFLYIVSPVPLILLSTMGWDEVGLCIMLVVIAIATLLLLTFKNPDARKKEEAPINRPSQEQKTTRANVKKLMRTLALVLFFLLSFSTGAWLVTWLVFPIEKALEGVVCAGLDLKGEEE